MRDVWLWMALVVIAVTLAATARFLGTPQWAP
jgi:hypothetical protein